jgi:hypothetical protein
MIKKIDALVSYKREGIKVKWLNLKVKTELNSNSLPKKEKKREKLNESRSNWRQP